MQKHDMGTTEPEIISVRVPEAVRFAFVSV
jgi:hypothetical protein